MHNAATPPSDLILSSEAARILGVSAQSVRAWANRGRLRAMKTANGLRVFARADVEALRASIEREQARDASPAA
jgi:excisionase family DNA binding protein